MAVTARIVVDPSAMIGRDSTITPLSEMHATGKIYSARWPGRFPLAQRQIASLPLLRQVWPRLGAIPHPRIYPYISGPANEFV